MNKQQKQEWKECDLSGCMFMPRCDHYFGRRCKKLGGKKIPRIKPKPRTVIMVTSPRYSYFMDNLAASRY